MSSHHQSTPTQQPVYLLYRSPKSASGVSLSTVLGDHIASNIHIAEEFADQQRIPIRRKAIWKNTLRCITSPTFVYNKGLNIVFVDEGAVDCGGPLRYMCIHVLEMATCMYIVIVGESPFLCINQGVLSAVDAGHIFK